MTSSSVPLGSRRSLVRRGPIPLTALDADGLRDLLVRSGGTPTQARAAAAKLVGYALRSAAGLSRPWDAAVLKQLGVGAWAASVVDVLTPDPCLRVAERAPSPDGTERLLLEAADGAQIETVLIPGPTRTTVCISSQVGCTRACTFCETGTLGLTRQLDTAEIVDQVRIARELWGPRKPALQNVVFMGMGEPFDNLAEVARATRILTDDRGMSLSASRVTVSTVGVADKLEPFFATCRAELAVSLNAPDDERRSRIMPINIRFPLATLIAALVKHTPRGHKVLFEYVLIEGFNDALDDAELLAKLVAPVRCRVNVIPVNPGPDPALRAPSAEALGRFVARLSELGVTTLVRRPRGQSVGGACGQLAGAARLVRPARGSQGREAEASQEESR